MPNTVRFHRVPRAAPENVYRSFLDPDAMAKWLPPNGFTGKVHQMDATVGGKFLELVPHERIRYTNQIPPEACCPGWQESLTLLADLVETDIPD